MMAVEEGRRGVPTRAEGCEIPRVLRTRRTMHARMSDAQLLHALLQMYENNVSALARAVLVRRETITRWRDKGDKLTLFEKDRKRLLVHLVELRGY